MKSSCGQCASTLIARRAFFATWETPVECQKCQSLNYRSHPLSQLSFILACGFVVILIVGFLYTDYDLSYAKTIYAFSITAVLYISECYLFPLKPLVLERKWKVERRQMLWVAIIFGLFVVMFFSVG